MFTTENAPRTGRPKGSKNKASVDIRQKFMSAWDHLDPEGNLSGDEVFFKWCRKNKSLYFTLFKGLAPAHVAIAAMDTQESFLELESQRLLDAEVTTSKDDDLAAMPNHETSDCNASESNTVSHVSVKMRELYK